MEDTLKLSRMNGIIKEGYNKMERREFLGGILIIQFIICCISATRVEFFSVYSSLSLYISIATLLLYFMLLRWKMNRKIFLFMLFFLVYQYFVVTVNAQSGFGSAVVISLSLFTLIEISDSIFDSKLKAFLNKIVYLSEILILISSVAFKNNWIYARESGTSINPNTIGMMLALLPMVYFLFSSELDRRKKYILMSMLIMSAVGMWWCQSRMTLVVLFLYFVMTFLPKKIFNEERTKIFIVLVIILGVLFPFIYMYIYQSGYTARVLGKNIYTGREIFWKWALHLLTNSWETLVFGVGSKATENLNLHNNYLDVLFNFGIVGFSFYYGLLCKIAFKCSKYMKDETVRRGVFMFISFLLVLGYTETTTLWTNLFVGVNIGLGVAWQKANLLEQGNYDI